jgi:hypothetical protein
MRFFEQALSEVRASVSPETEREYERLAEELKRRANEPRRMGFNIDIGEERAPERRMAAD